MTRTKSTRTVTVGTTKKSRATTSCTWFFRKVFHVGDGGFLGRVQYFSTVDFATSTPSFRSSPTIRGEPHAGVRLPHLAYQVAHLLGKRWPARGPSLAQAPPVRTEALPLPGNHRAGLDKCEHVLPPGPEPREPDPEETISWVEPRARHRLLVDGH